MWYMMDAQAIHFFLVKSKIKEYTSAVERK